ncbi:MAG: response regulator transcription factor [Sulfuritalea sp.]|nr:response regulator transcription factor [Sulfuritalea sp.]
MTESIRIIIIDDHPLFRAGVAHSLGVEPDFTVIGQAENGEDGIDLAKSLRPDVVMLDVSMPGIDGIATAARIAAALPETRIIMLTVSENEDSLMAALKAGAHGYVLKGVSSIELRAIIRRVAGGEAYVTPLLAGKMLTELSRPSGPAYLEELTKREVEVLELLSQGLANREIGERLHLAEKTIKHHISGILQKLQVRSRTEAAIIALKHAAPQR